MYIFFIMFVCSQAQNINVFFERLEHLKECAKYTNDDNVPDFCFNVAKYGLRRSRRSSNHIFSKSKVHQNAKCGLPCQKTRLYTKPEKLKVLFDGWMPYKLDGRLIKRNEFLDIGECAGSCQSASPSRSLSPFMRSGCVHLYSKLVIRNVHTHEEATTDDFIVNRCQCRTIHLCES